MENTIDIYHRSNLADLPYQDDDYKAHNKICSDFSFNDQEAVKEFYHLVTQDLDPFMQFSTMFNTYLSINIRKLTSEFRNVFFYNMSESLNFDKLPQITSKGIHTKTYDLPLEVTPKELIEFFKNVFYRDLQKDILMKLLMIEKDLGLTSNQYSLEYYFFDLRSLMKNSEELGDYIHCWYNYTVKILNLDGTNSYFNYKQKEDLENKQKLRLEKMLEEDKNDYLISINRKYVDPYNEFLETVQ